MLTQGWNLMTFCKGILYLLKVHLWDFSCGPVVKNPPSNAEDLDSIPDRGIEIPRASGQLISHVAITEPVCHN